MAAQIRRDWLAQQLSEALSSSAEKAELRTEDGRRSQGELEASLAKAMRLKQSRRCRDLRRGSGRSEIAKSSTA